MAISFHKNAILLRTRYFLKTLPVWKQYYLNPKICLCCSKELDWFKRYGKYCSRSCGAIVNNTGSKHSVETKLKISKTISAGVSARGVRKVGSPKAQYTRVKLITCPLCNNTRYVPYLKKYCSTECAITKRIRNGIRSTQYVYNGIFLDSSWELKLAQFLDTHHIKWLRPKGIKYGKKTYYPDFYLPEHDLYLDPKNPYAMIKGKSKMDQVSKLINIWYGDVDMLMARLERFELSCDPVTFQLVRSEQGYKRI